MKCSLVLPLLKGVVMGASDVVPGVSGGTMALILGIYERLLRAIKSFDRTAWALVCQKNIRALWQHVDATFLFSVVFGMGLAIIVLSHPLTWLLANKPAYLLAFFFGLVLSSAALLRKRITQRHIQHYILAVVGASIGWLIAGLVPGETAHTPILFFLSGFVAICAMMLPGISGSFLLVILGKYEQVLYAVRTGDVVTLMPFAIGMVFGLFLFAKFLSWLLATHHDAVLALLIGLMLGSLKKILPWQEGVAGAQNGWIIFWMIIGVAVVLILHCLSKNKKTVIV